MELLIPIVLERVLAINIGGLSIYYRLFYAVKATGEGQAQVKLFGASVVGASLLYPVHYKDSSGEARGAPGTALEVSEFGPEPRKPAAVVFDCART